MKFDSYIVSDTKTAFSVPIERELLPKKSLKQKAFTLAETLITLSIIGVVAAMTVPTLMANITKAQYVSRLKKAYSNLQNAVRMLPVSNGCTSGDYDCAELTNQNLSAEFKLAKPAYSCDWWSKSSEYYCINTIDGITYLLANQSNPINSTIGVDVNGDKGPNQVGRDRFLFELRYLYSQSDDNSCKTVIPVGSKLHAKCGTSRLLYWNNNPENPLCSKTRLTYYCTGRVLEEGKMDY